MPSLDGDDSERTEDEQRRRGGAEEETSVETPGLVQDVADAEWGRHEPRIDGGRWRAYPPSG